ncbi:MAG: Zn-dependent hydrolase [Synergistota bacterium]|nr:Zn-dependent hydrolase [Synergistota bacterium]
MGCGSLKIDGESLLARIREFAEIGRDDSEGRTRLALSEGDGMARDRLVGWMRELDLEVRIDPVGNIFGILRGEDESCSNALMIGSHIDTVIEAGPLDGVYGVLSGLAVARAFRESGLRPRRTLMVAAFTNEEGVRFQPDMLGSLFFAGGISLEEALAARGTDGALFGEELRRIGYAGDADPADLHPAEYLELHVEQGPVLDSEGIDIGVVEDLQGISWRRVLMEGAANHAGTTPMPMRSDAGYAAARAIVFLRELAAASGSIRTTVGTLSLSPGAINVIPSRAEFTVDMRDPDEERLLRGEREFTGFLDRLKEEEGVKISVESLARFEPVRFDFGLADSIEAVAKGRSLSTLRMTSGAGHDAQMLARVCRTAMIFVPSRDGISHSPAEFTPEEQLLNGANVLMDVAFELLQKSGKGL